MGPSLLPLPRRAAAFLSVMAAGPALAEAPSSAADVFVWGERTVATVRIEPAADHPATVVFANELTYGNPADMDFVLVLDGLSVEVVMTLGAGELPDVILVEPPPGYEAHPRSLSVPEGETGRIELRYLPMS